MLTYVRNWIHLLLDFDKWVVDIMYKNKLWNLIADYLFEKKTRRPFSFKFSVSYDKAQQKTPRPNNWKNRDQTPWPHIEPNEIEPGEIRCLNFGQYMSYPDIMHTFSMFSTINYIDNWGRNARLLTRPEKVGSAQFSLATLTYADIRRTHNLIIYKKTHLKLF